jgi:rifampicin phosphotransferase
MNGVVFTAPGPGSWELESTHHQRPIARFGAAPEIMDAFAAGMAEGAARYGLMLDHMQPRVVNGFVYHQVVPFGADGTASPEQMQARVMTSVRAFEDRQWRADLARWDTVDRPAAVAAHRAIQQVDPAALSDEQLAGYLRRCFAHMRDMIGLHQRYTVASSAAVGDFLATTQEWTGASTAELAALLRGTTPVSTGFAADELDALAAAVRGSASAAAALAAPTPAGDTLEALEANPDVGPQARAYLDAVRFRSLGYDIGDATAGEMPELLVGAIRAAVDGASATPHDDTGTARVRARVPEQHRAAFDGLLEEARVVNRLRDERGAYSDGWATGLARRAVLEAGRRLHGTGRLAEPAHAIDADVDELVALLRGEPGPSAEEVAERVRWRTTHTVEDAPALLGDPPVPPPPLDVLPPPARRAARALMTLMTHMFAVPDGANSATVLRGTAVNDGVYEGTARLVDDAADFGRIRHGDVLVARTTSPYFNVVLPLLGAIVTDRGGQLCHAAIVAREYGIPGIVGTREATRRIPDGARVRVDGAAGEVRLLG